MSEKGTECIDSAIIESKICLLVGKQNRRQGQ